MTAIRPSNSWIQPDIDRLIGMDFLRATEFAALNTLQWIGKGDKESADAAACDAIRGMFDLMDIRGEVVIGEGIKDEAPGLFKGERVGLWREGTPRFDIALDPIDGTTNVAKGLPNSLSCIAGARREEGGEYSLQEIPAFYMKKLTYPPKVRVALLADPTLPIAVNAPVGEMIKAVAKILDKEVRNVVVMLLDRPRNQDLVDGIRRVGASLRRIGDGDIAAALAPALRTSNIDLYVGVGGAPEGVLSAAALRCLGGGMQAQIWSRDEKEVKSLIAAGWGDRLDTVFLAQDLARGEEIIFCGTGINDSPLLKGVEVKSMTATTHSILMRVKSRTVRFISALHDLKSKKIYLRSRQGEVPL